MTSPVQQGDVQDTAVVPSVTRAREMVVRYRPTRLPLPVEGKVRTPGEAARLVAPMLADETVENVVVLHLDARKTLIGVHRVAQGTLDGALVHPREVFKAALLANASAVVVAHNHPSGDPAPSDDDVLLTQRLVAAGELLGVQVLDHVVVGQGGAYCSMREMARL
jgi:DNA repair protein RadC